MLTCRLPAAVISNMAGRRLGPTALAFIRERRSCWTCDRNIETDLWLSSARLQSSLANYKNAVEAAAANPQKAALLLDQQARRQMARSEDDFKVFLAPFLHGKR